MLRFFILLTMSLGLAATASARSQADDTAKKDLDLMQGVWKVVELTEKGEKLPAKELTPVQAFIAGMALTLSDDGKFREEITLKLSATARQKAVDFVYTKGPNQGKTELGIYTIDGDTLMICMNETKGGARPTAFASTKDNNWSVVVLKRVKK